MENIFQFTFINNWIASGFFVICHFKLLKIEVLSSLNLFVIRFLTELLISVSFSLRISVNYATDEGGIFLSINEYRIRLSKNSKLSFPILCIFCKINCLNACRSFILLS